ncbi:uncharacterized protein LOC121003425 [Bufo bufo]|uniref:uncharacterized protein LOC121003425 n=1 Tax=Bufo bufo TaxID=8384 RepID=UPI001ABE2BED|nr:uncharacterized protein LOC121003425 [Bufo bufo]
MDYSKNDKKQKMYSTGRLLKSRYPNVGNNWPMHQKLPGSTHITPKDAGDLFITGISVSKLKDQSLENHANQKVSITQNVTSAQTSGWRLKAVPVNNVPIICSYTRPLQITLHGCPLTASSSRTQQFIRQFGSTLGTASSESWWNYRFATYTILSRKPGKPCRESNLLAGHESQSHNHLQRQEVMTRSNQYNKYLCMKPLLTDSSTQTQSPQDVHLSNPEEYNTFKEKDPSHLDPGGSTNRMGKLGKRMRKQKSGYALSIPSSPKNSGSRIYCTEPGVPVMSPEPWSSPHTPEEEEISITVPLLPKLQNFGQ